MKRLLLLFALLCFAPYLSAQIVREANSCITGSTSCTIGLSVVAGDTLIVFNTTNSVPDLATVSGSNSTSFTSVFTNTEDSGLRTSNSLWTATIPTTNASYVVTCTVTNSINYMTCAAADIGVSATVDTASGNPVTTSNESTSSWVTGSLTTIDSPDVLIAFFGSTLTGPPTFGSGYTLLTTNNAVSSYAALAYIYAPSAGSQAGSSITVGTASSGLAGFLALKLNGSSTAGVSVSKANIYVALKPASSSSIVRGLHSSGWQPIP